MITIRQKISIHKTVNISLDEAHEITEKYIRILFGEEGYYVTPEGNLHHWTSWPHGSGTTTKKGKASALQLAAANLLFLILIEKDKPQKD